MSVYHFPILGQMYFTWWTWVRCCQFLRLHACVAGVQGEKQGSILRIYYLKFSKSVVIYNIHIKCLTKSLPPQRWHKKWQINNRLQAIIWVQSPAERAIQTKKSGSESLFYNSFSLDPTLVPVWHTMNFYQREATLSPLPMNLGAR